MKVRPVGTPAHPPRNYAHLPCIVQVDFFGSPHEGATLTAVSQAPTAPSGQTLLTTTMTFDQSSANPRGNELVGTTTLDFSGAVDGLSHHPQQGYHVKLTAVQDGPQGGDVKHKVFWIDCPAPSAAESSAAESSATTQDDDATESALQTGARDQAEAEVEDEGAAAAVEGEVMGISGSRDDTEVAGVFVERDTAAASADRGFLGSSGVVAGLAGLGGALAQTGLGAVGLAALGLVGLGTGAGMLRRYRRR
jgi:hypothetical protein